VGGGPGGLTLALLLARAGTRVSVYEQAASFEREFRGDSLLPSGLRILEDLGLREQLGAMERASPTALRLRFGGTREIYESPPWRLADGSPIATSIPQPQLLGAIAGAAAAFPGFELHAGSAVRGLVREGERVVGVRHAGGEERGDLVVGFDGRFSTVRRSAGIELEAARVGFDVAWCLVAAPPGGEDRYEAVVRGDEVCFWYPSGSRVRVGWLLRKGGFAALRAAGFERFKSALLEAATDPLRVCLAEGVRSWEDVTLLPAVSEIATRWRLPGMLLLGDAAHPMSPVGAQGINVALQDAVVAARRLLPTQSLDAACASIEAERRLAVRRIARIQNMLPRLMLALGPERALRLAVAVLRPMLRSRYRPGFVRAAVESFLWGDPPVRVKEGDDEKSEPAAEQALVEGGRRA
jgi:2-polyprenyl-6-methoxyphenol hydroxylase-like FAD-dependent oxidoreductase